jgi:hypothetical protein
MAASSVFAKMNLKDQKEIVVLHAPDSFEPEIAALDGVTVRRKLSASSRVAFGVAFVITQSDVDAVAPSLARAAEGDAVIWFAYPKGSSKRYKASINRDRGWDVMGKAGFEPVRMVAIDEDWSAVRFRRADYIKTMTRDVEHAMSKKGTTAKRSAKRSS